MYLLIDAGNTHLKYSYEKAGKFHDIQRLQHDELSESYFNAHWKSVDQIIIASVAKASIVTQILQWSANLNIKVQQVHSEIQRFSVTVGYENVSQFGVDRWLALIGAAKIFPQQTCLIVDSGTATTVDLLTDKGKHIGGWIFPGLDLMTTSLSLNTANIGKTQALATQVNFENNTQGNVINGCVAATVGAIELAIKQVNQYEQTVDQFILTGGKADQLSGYFNGRAVVINELVFHGLSCYLNH